jgi:hypothetical protein
VTKKVRKKIHENSEKVSHSSKEMALSTLDNALKVKIIKA